MARPTTSATSARSARTWIWALPSLNLVIAVWIRLLRPAWVSENTTSTASSAKALRWTSSVPGPARLPE